MNKKMMREDDDIENMGIMQGFMDSMDDEGDDEGDDDPEMMMERRPDSPEILMNNLRGDMRSVDARRDELADLVGYQAATETPEQVLAMLQPILAKQGGGGIGALPQSQDMAQGPQPPMMGGAPGMPPPGMPPMPPDAGMPPPPDQGGIAGLMAGMGGGAPGAGAPPPGMPPSDMPPVAMARGGYVQNFQAGSDEEGVTPAGKNPSEDLMLYPPEMVAAAKKASSSLFSQAPLVAPTLEKAMESRLPEYTRLLGADRGASEAQMLFDLGQRAFNFASNTDDSGRPLRGGFASRLAGAVKTLPSAMGRRIDEIAKIDRQLKVMALQQGEKDIDQVTAQNSDLQRRKQALLGQVLTAQARVDAKKAGEKASGPLGKGSKGDILNTLIQYAPLYAAGALEPEQRNTFMTAVTDYTQPTTTEFIDPETQLKSIRTQRNELPDFVRQALGSSAPKASTTTSGGPPPPVRGPVGLTEAAVPPAVYQVAATAPKSSFFDLAATGTGFVPVLVAGVARNVPLDVAGKIGPEFQQSTAMLQSMTNRVVNVLQENPRFAVAEQQQILKELKTAPRVFSNKNGYINQIIALDNVVEGLQKRQESVRDEPKTGVTARQEAIKKLEDIASIRELFGIQQRTITDPAVWKNLPPGEYIVIDPQTGFKVVQPKYSGPAGPAR
jgi:peptidoglycan hydrolase CwlO-like protein